MTDGIPTLDTSFFGASIVSLSQFDRPALERIFAQTAQIKQSLQNNNQYPSLAGKLVALHFSEPSTRTFSSFATAVKRMGGQTLEFQNAAQTSSATKGETIEDTVTMLSTFVDAIVMRHPEVGSVARAADVASVPVVNAGDGAGEHPTQALMDLFTVYERHGSLDGITGVIAGDLKYGRTVHSLLQGLALFSDVTVYLLADAQLQPDQELIDQITQRGVTIHQIEKPEEMPTDAQFWYWTRVQAERLGSSDQKTNLQTLQTYRLTTELLTQKAADDTLLLHPLPRVDEIDPAVDADPRALYLTTQVQNGLYTRMALLQLILSDK